ncbi:MAG: hypothetical protein MJ070_10170 [Lachnospiraceae bacterium]|nr:hypothetical protein [Lachnospiraceae bacterium]
MKKILSVLLLLVLIASLPACSRSGPAEETLPATEAETLPETIPETEAPSGIRRGTVSGKTYVSDYAGLTFAAPKTWTFSDEDELEALSGVRPGQLTDAKLKKLKTESFFDMKATEKKTGNNVNVTYENLVIAGVDSLSDSALAEWMRNALHDMYDQMNCNYLHMYAPAKVTLGSETYTRVAAEVQRESQTMVQGSYFRRIDDYLVIITITTFDLTPLPEYESLFS